MKFKKGDKVQVHDMPNEHINKVGVITSDDPIFSVFAMWQVKIPNCNVSLQIPESNITHLDMFERVKQ